MGNPAHTIGKVCYALVNYIHDGKEALILALCRSPEAALNEYARNFELKRVEQREQLRFISGLKKPCAWAIHEVHMDMVHSCGILKNSYAVRLEHDAKYGVGYVHHDHEMRKKVAEPDARPEPDAGIFAIPDSVACKSRNDS